ncbi:MAG: class I SAM-dependent DNA methyltransferase [Porcipelethomonas sp.]
MNNSYGIFAEFYDELTENVDYRRRGEYFSSLIEKHGGKKNGVLLDLACGTGTLSEYFDSLGYDVIGVDNSPDMLCAAMNKKAETGSSIQYVCQDMGQLDLYGCVDITICALDSLNHLKDLDEVRKTFEGVYRFTEKGGIFIFDMNTEYKHRRVLGDNTFVYETEDVYCVWQNSCENSTVSISLDFFVPDENGSYERYSEDFTETAYSAETVSDVLKDIGFEVLGIYAGDSFEQLMPDSVRMVFAVRRPESS